MSTNDVPGARAENMDELHGGCWAEHEDGSLIYVQGTENGRVIFEIFDFTNEDRPVEYRDAMGLSEFEKRFSWNPKKKDSLKWTWHDKTPFPWDRIVKSFESGVKPTSAAQFIEDADRVSRARKRHLSAARQAVSGRAVEGKPVRSADVRSRADRELPRGSVARRVRDVLQRAIDELLPGRGEE